MPNKNYIKGRRKEYKISHEYIDKGFDISQRTAGSHSPFDIISISIKDKEIRLTQAKPNSMPDSMKMRIMKENEGLNGLFKVIFEVV